MKYNTTLYRFNLLRKEKRMLVSYSLPKKLIVAGMNGYVRNLMINGVLTVLNRRIHYNYINS